MTLTLTSITSESDTRQEYIVALLDDDGFITLATRRVFSEPSSACEYARSCAPARKALVILGNWRGLRFA